VLCAASAKPDVVSQKAFLEMYADFVAIFKLALFNLSSHKGVVSYDENYEK